MLGKKSGEGNAKVPTGMGYARDFINALSADAVIIIGGETLCAPRTCTSDRWLQYAVLVEWQMSMMENTWTIGKNSPCEVQTLQRML